MSCGCLILTPKYQLASRMNSIFPFWTNARLVDSADVTGPVSNGLRVTGGPGRVVKLAHLSRSILLLLLLQYIRPQSKRGRLDTDTSNKQRNLQHLYFRKKEEKVSGILLQWNHFSFLIQYANSLSFCLCVCVCAGLQRRLQPWKASTPWLVSFWSSVLFRAAGRFLCTRRMTAQGTEI